MCIYIYVYMYMYMYIYIYVYIYVYVCVYIYVYIYICIYVYVYVYIYMYIYIYVYIYVYVYNLYSNALVIFDRSLFLLGTYIDHHAKADRVSHFSEEKIQQAPRKWKSWTAMPFGRHCSMFLVLL